MESKKLIRINKYLSEIGFCSRRNAEELIKQKRVTINGELAKLGQKISEKDVILVNGKTIKRNYEKKYYLLIIYYYLKIINLLLIVVDQ